MIKRSVATESVMERHLPAGGHKRIVAPDGSEIAPTSNPEPDGTLIKALARAWRWQRMLEGGEHATLAELADAERISRSYVCRVLGVRLLAPDIVEHILDGRRTPERAQLMQPLEAARTVTLCMILAARRWLGPERCSTWPIWGAPEKAAARRGAASGSDVANPGRSA
jgi:hypothetical protein